MKCVLTEKVHKKICHLYELLGKEIQCKWQMCQGKTMKYVEEIIHLLIQRDSWERKKKKV